MAKRKKLKLQQVLSNYQREQEQREKRRKAEAQAKQRQNTHKKPSSKAVQLAQIRQLERIESELYRLEDSILLIGEGNFSFAHALVKHRLDGHGQSIIATAYDSEEVTRVKYPEVDEHVNAIKAAGATVLFNVDGTNLSATSALKGRRFTKIVFNFPHAGAGIKDQDRNIRVNQELILGFFHSAIHFLTGPEHGDAIAGEIHVTLKSGMPYDQWNVRQLARAAGLACRRSLAFRPQIYPGYVHRRTLGFQEGLSAAENEEIIDKQPKTIIFIRAAPPDETTTKRKKQTASARNTKKRRVPTNQDSDDSDGDIKDNIEENDDDIFVE